MRGHPGWVVSNPTITAGLLSVGDHGAPGGLRKTGNGKSGGERVSVPQPSGDQAPSGWAPAVFGLRGGEQATATATATANTGVLRCAQNDERLRMTSV
jgi:hypothetical protein